MIAVLYITRNGMLEPLGQSQVLGYLRGLSVDYRITLISFEKPADLAKAKDVAQVRADCDSHGIRWLPQRFHHRPRFVSPAWNMLVLLWLCMREVRLGNAGLIHARSYIPATIALLVNRLMGTPFIFDMRALWPEELITAGRLRRGSLMHRAIVWVERCCLARAAAVISLTQAAEVYLRQRYPKELEVRSIWVIPTCADLERFVLASRPVAGPRVYGCLGTVLSGWFRLSWLSMFFRVAAARDGEAEFEVVTRDDPELVRAAVDPDSRLQGRLRVFAMPPNAVHEAIQGQHVSVMFYASGEVSELGRSPTRLGEVLGCGLPVVANRGVGDVAKILTGHKVGVLVEEPSDESMAVALDALDELLQQRDLAVRCRQAAEEVFSLSSGTTHLSLVWKQAMSEGSGR